MSGRPTLGPKTSRICSLTRDAHRTP